MAEDSFFVKKYNHTQLGACVFTAEAARECISNMPGSTSAWCTESVSASAATLTAQQRALLDMARSLAGLHSRRLLRWRWWTGSGVGKTGVSGGLKFPLHLGALDFLEERGAAPRAYAGSSCGAVVAALVTAGYRPSQLHKLCKARPLSMFQVSPQKWGMCKPAGKDEVRDLLRKRPSCRKQGSSDPTFRVLKEETGKDLFVTAMRVRDGKLVIFGAEEATMDLPIHEAVTASCSIPFLNPAIELDGELYLDGALGAYLPMRAFEHIEDKQTVTGLMICNARERETPLTFEEYSSSVGNIVLERLSEPQKAWESNRTIHYDANELGVFESPNAGLADIMFSRGRNTLQRWAARHHV
ncbi:hypothetical protein KFL_010390020 [Klebsormidium nitens]|uniref:Patatin n=1 Tax=Klebsormidium nitens TaxID=105231 RepID=A0A1Y1IT84_KLENI|nr:hypothetical protein KFL_010390020 [Klebsormidium nitens]|eukprot:GAQ92521.1 hypothetical protein KFL_010390020 [Klebsormidium nitens]